MRSALKVICYLMRHKSKLIFIFLFWQYFHSVFYDTLYYKKFILDSSWLILTGPLCIHVAWFPRLPGLLHCMTFILLDCLYSSAWLQNAHFPHFLQLFWYFFPQVLMGWHLQTFPNRGNYLGILSLMSTKLMLGREFKTSRTFPPGGSSL